MPPLGVRLLIGQLVQGMLPQKRVLDLAPILAKDNLERETEQLTDIIEKSMHW